VIVIDNNSNDGSKYKIKKQFKKHKNLRMIENKENLGCSKAINQGFKTAKSLMILTLDEDVILHKDLLKELVKVILSEDNIGAVSPKIFNYQSKKLMGIGFKISNFIGKTTVIGENQIDNGQFDNMQKVDYVPGAVILAKKEVIDKIDGMDEDYFLYYGDANYCLSIRKAGYNILYVPTAIAWHDCNTSEGFNSLRMYNFTKSKLIFMKKNSKVFNKFIFFLFFFCLYSPMRIISFLIKRKFILIFAYFKGLKDGVLK